MLGVSHIWTTQLAAPYESDIQVMLFFWFARDISHEQPEFCDGGYMVSSLE